MTVAWSGEKCGLCQEVLREDELPRNIGSAHMPFWCHDKCDIEAAMTEIRNLQRRVYLAESVLWAKFRIQEVGEKSVDPESDRKHYEERWNAWLTEIRSL